MRLICFGDSWTAGNGIEDLPNYSMSDLLIDYEIKNKDINSVWEFNKRRPWREEDGQLIVGGHPNEFGYKIIAEYIYNKIKDVYITMIENNPIPNKKLI
jgi:hypothetical protein